ncbi:MAG TPA: SRPBCC domain-containing protein, partial [Gemmatimonadales bacterium]|nr:SRPBCC domain-containing protein [Gemmatimonadales bacterium]
QGSLGIAHDAEAIHQEVAFAAGPTRLFEAILDEKQFAQVTGLPCKIERVPGGAFTLFGNRIVGRTIALVDNQRIVQVWRSEGWADPGAYSLIRFELRPAGTGTSLVFDHAGFPKGEAQHLAEGWGVRYWEPLKRFLG